MRKSLALILSAGLLLSLAACSGSPAGPDCSAMPASGDSSNAVSVTGDIGAKSVTATFPSPLVANETEATVLVTDDEGTPAGPGGTVDVVYSIFDGDTGTEVGQAKSGLVALSESLPEGLRNTLGCTGPGERVAVVLPNDIGTQIDPDATGSVVMVFDVVTAYPQAANGSDQPAASGFPSVVHDENGRPGVLIAGEAPTEAKSTLLKKGDGPVVAEGDALLVQRMDVSYTTKKVDTANSTWETGTPQLWLASDDTTKTQGSKQPPQIAQYLIGQTIGSEVLVVVPDSSGSATAYVIDLLGIVTQP